MEVAHRLFPETDMVGMVGDVYRDIAWMKEQAGALGFDPASTVIGGASADAHLSLLAAYSNSGKFVPKELTEASLSVHSVICEYGPTDLSLRRYNMLRLTASLEYCMHPQRTTLTWRPRLSNPKYRVDRP